MAVADAPKTFADLYTALQNRLRLDTTNSATLAQCKQYVNLGLMDMHIGFGEKFPWAERSAILLTNQSYSTGTVSITQGSTALTGASTLWTTTNGAGIANVRAGGKLVLNGGTDIYEVSSVDSATGITLATTYIGATLSADTYTYFEDEYALAADFLKPIDQQNFDDGLEIPLISRTDFRRQFPRVNTVGKIQAACITDRAPSANTTPRRRVRFYRPPSTWQRIPYTYVTKYLATSSAGVAAEILSSDTDEPIVPYIYRHGIVLHALYNWYRDKKDDQRSAEAKAEHTDFVLRIAADGDVAQPRPRLQPRTSPYARSARRPWSGARGRYDASGRFDYMG